MLWNFVLKGFMKDLIENKTLVENGRSGVAWFQKIVLKGV